MNNSLGFPGILKGALLVRARKITDEMAIAAAYSIAKFAERKKIHPDRIMPTMDETEVFAYEAADVAMEAIKNGVARTKLSREEVYNTTFKDISEARTIVKMLMKKKHIKRPPEKMIKEALKKAIDAVK